MGTADLLFEIGCEELPASFVAGALDALPALAQKRLDEKRLAHGAVRALGTPRRLALLVEAVALHQPDLEEQVLGPPVKAAFKDGAPTKAATAFAEKLGCTVESLERVTVSSERGPKGEYLRGMRREQGRPAMALLPELLAALLREIPFRKSMRWGTGTITFGRPLRWLVALLGEEVVPVEIAELRAGRSSYGHRFLQPGAVTITSPSSYVGALRDARVLVDPDERSRTMRERLCAAAASAGGTLIDDDFLVGENLSLVEDPQVVVGGFDEEFLELPEAVILAVARGHQRYFGMRAPDGRLLSRYLAVVNTAENPALIRRGNDRVMRARLADARFFLREDAKRSLGERRKDLAGIVFQNRLGTVLAKVERMEKLVALLAARAGLEAHAATAVAGAGLCKCDLVSLMVGEFPELQGSMGREYALRQGIAPEVAEVIEQHYRPKGAGDEPAASPAGALVAMADRLDTLVGCFAIGLQPTGGADPFALRRACLGALRTILRHHWSLSLRGAFSDAYGLYGEVKLDAGEAEVSDKLAQFFSERLRGLLCDRFPTDVVDASVAVHGDRPLEAERVSEAIMGLDAATRARLGEVFKRASNIAKQAPSDDGAATAGSEPAEVALFGRFREVASRLEALRGAGDYANAFAALADLAPALARYFEEVLVMAEDPAVRQNRLRLMREISASCAALAKVELLGG